MIGTLCSLPVQGAALSIGEAGASKLEPILDPWGAKPYKFIGFGDIHGPKPYKFIGFALRAAGVVASGGWASSYLV